MSGLYRHRLLLAPLHTALTIAAPKNCVAVVDVESHSRRRLPATRLSACSLSLSFLIRAPHYRHYPLLLRSIALSMTIILLSSVALIFLLSMMI